MSISAPGFLRAARRKPKRIARPISVGAVFAWASLCGILLTPDSACADVKSLRGYIDSLTVSSAEEEILVAANIGRFRVADDITAIFLGSSLCVDIQQVFNALDFPIMVDQSRQSASGWFIRETRTISLDFRSATGVIEGKPITLDPQSLGLVSTGQCMTTGALGKLLGIRLEYSPSGSLLSVSSKDPLPLFERLKRQERKETSPNGASRSDAVVPTTPPLPYRAFVPPNTDVALVFGGARTPRSSWSDSLAWSTFSVGELAFMTAEAQLSGSQRGFDRETARVRLYREERDGGVFGIPQLTEFSVGDVSGLSSALGSAGGQGLGVSASTFPLNRPTSFDRTDFQGPLPTGWDVELYRNGQLLEARNNGTTGGYAFKDVPVLFGENSFQIIQYGPQGQRRVINRRINATNFLAPKGKSYYRAAIYQPELTLARRQPNSDVRVNLRGAVGIADNLSLGAGLDSYEYGGRRLSIGSVSAQTSFAGMAVNTELFATAAQRLAGQLELQSLGNGYGLRGRFLLAEEGFQSERISGNQMAQLDISLDQNLRFSEGVSGTLSGRFEADRYYGGEYAFRARERLTLSYGNAWLAQSLSWNHSSSGQRRDQISGDFAYNRRHGLFGLRGAVNFSLYPDVKLDRLSAIVERSFAVSDESWRWRAEASWLASEDNFIYAIAAGRMFNSVNLDVVAETDGADTHRLGVSMSFAFGRRSNGWGLTSRSLAPNGTVRARIFEDLDEDGRFSAGDIPVSQARIVTNASQAGSVSDANGFAVLEAVNAIGRTQVQVVTDDLEDSHLFGQPTYTRLRQGTVADLAVPLRPMGAVEGIVSLMPSQGTSANPIGGLELVLLDRNQKEVARTQSAYDGFFSFDSVPVGAYSVKLAPDSALASRLRTITPTEVVTTRHAPTAQNIAMTLIEANPTNTRMALRGLS